MANRDIVPMGEREKHWQGIYTDKAEDEVTWFQASPDVSLSLIEKIGLAPDARIIDIGGGSSRLVDSLLGRGFRNLTVLDVADKALDQARERLGSRASSVEWVVTDVTAWDHSGPFGLWHDRAAFHFLVEECDRAAYRRVLEQALLTPDGQAIIGTFALDGPEQCSGLPVRRYDGDSLARELGPALRLAETARDDHVTPKGNVQRFQFSRFILA